MQVPASGPSSVAAEWFPVGDDNTSGLGVISSAELVVVRAFFAVVVVQLSSFVV